MLNLFLASSLVILFPVCQEFHTHLHTGKERKNGRGRGTKVKNLYAFNQGLIFLPEMVQRFIRQK